MAYASITYTSASGTTFALTNSNGDPIEYLRQADIYVYVNTVLKTLTTDYTFNSAGTAIVLNTAVSGATVTLKRITAIDDPTVVYTAGSTLTAQDLNNADNQIRFGLQEFTDYVAGGQGVTDGDKGDITVGVNGSVWTVNSADSGNVTFSSGRLLVGTSTTASYNHLLQVRSDSGTVAEFLTSTETTNLAAYLAFSRSRGSAGSPTVVSSGDNIGSLFFSGYSGSAYTGAAEIRAEIDGNPGANDMPGRLVFSTTADGAASPTERMRIGSSGQIMVGTTNTNGNAFESGATFGLSLNPNNGQLTNCSNNAPAAYFNRTASDGPLLVFNRNGAGVGNISVTASATSYNTSSDYRLKENVVSLTGAVDRLNQLQVHRFNFLADPDKTVDGFLAHEAQAIVPECVTGTKDAVDEDGNPIYQGIDQSKLVPLLTAALQEAIAKIETLEARLTAAGIA